MAVAGYVFDGDPAPPLLLTAFDLQTYTTDFMNLPAALFLGAKHAYNAYHALHGYKSAAGKTAQWADRNPEAWAFVSDVLKARMGNG